MIMARICIKHKRILLKSLTEKKVIWRTPLLGKLLRLFIKQGNQEDILQLDNSNKTPNQGNLPGDTIKQRQPLVCY